MPNQDAIVIIFFTIFVFFVLFIGIIFLKFFPLWLLSKTSGAGVNFFDLLGMTFRRVKPKAIIQSKILAAQNGLNVSTHELESAYLQGVNLEKATLAWIEATRQNRGFSFQDIVDAERRSRLANMS